MKRTLWSLRHSQLFCYLLAAILIVTSTPYLGAFADDPLEGINTTDLLQFQRETSKLDDHFSARPDGALPLLGNTQHPLDFFHVLRQVVVDRRQEEIQEQVNEAQARHNEELLAFRIEQINNGPHLTDAEKAELIANVERLYEESPEILDDMIDTDVKPRKFYGLNLIYEIRDSNGVAVHSLNEKEFQGSFSNRFDSLNKAFNSNGDEVYQIFIMSKKGEVVSEIEIPVKNATLWGNYLVFTEANTYDAETKTMPVRLIDLEYFRGAIGNSNLPIYSIPVSTEEPIASLNISKGDLMLNGIRAKREYVDLIAKVHQVIYNITVALLDPATVEKNENLIRELAYYSDVLVDLGGDFVKGQAKDVSGGLESLQSLVEQSQAILQTQASVGPPVPLKPVVEALEKADNEAAENGERLIADRDPLVAQAMRNVRTNMNLQQGLLKTNHSNQIARKLLSRLNLLLARITNPQPNGSAKILQALATVSAGITRFNGEEVKAGFQDIKNHPYLRYLFYGSAATGGAFLSQFLPPQYQIHLADVLAMGSNVIQHIQGYFSVSSYGANYLDLVGQAASNSAESVWNENGLFGAVRDAYIGADETPRLLVGVGMLVTFIGGMFGTLHLTANSLQIFKKMKGHWAVARDKGKNLWGSFVETFKEYSFVRHQRETREEYDRNAAIAEQEMAGGGELRELSPTELKDLEYHIDKLQGKTGELKDLDIHTADGAESSAAADRLTDDIKNKTAHFHEINTFSKALKNFFFSYPSLLTTYKFVGRIWNYGFIGRSFVLRPKLWYMMATYPKFFRTTISAGRGAAQVPTQFNGGLRRTWQTGRFWANKVVNGSFFNSDLEALNKIKEWEGKILPIEQEVTKLALEKSISALVHYVDDPRKLEGLFDSGTLPKMGLTNEQIRSSVSPSTGLSGLVDKKIKKVLNVRERTFFRAYFQKAHEETMTEYLRRVAVSNGYTEDQVDPMTAQEIKIATLDHSDSFRVDKVPGAVEGIENPSVRAFANSVMDQVIEDKKVERHADLLSRAVGRFRARFLSVNFQGDAMAAVNPAGPQLQRFLTFEEKVDKFSAALRAMRSELAGLVVNIPMQLAAKFIVFAGITEGVLMPLSEQMFGPDSFFYLSRYMFYTGFLYGTFISFMADFWMKLQVDARIDDDGNFDRMPSIQDRQKSFWRSYFKQLRNPNNKWWQNQFHLIKLITANIPAAFVTFAIGYLAFLGRFDVGAFLAGYAMVYMTPFQGLTYKLEQGFELASNWIKAQIPRDLRGSTQAASAINAGIQKKKFKFQMMFQTYEILLGSITSKFSLMGTEEYGSRSFLRMLFGGYTPTELLASGLRNLGELGSVIPGFQEAMQSCEEIFTNNYTDWQKTPSTEEFYGK